MSSSRPQRTRPHWLALGVGLLLAAGSCFSPATAQGGRFGSVRLDVSLNPRRVPADGQTQARLRIEARDASGQPLPDDTPVVIHTDLGSLSATGADRQPTLQLSTRGGVVTAWAVSETPGAAMLTVTCQDSRSRVYLDFLRPGEAGLSETRVVHLSGAWLGYAMDLDMVEARGEAVADLGRARLEGADLLQLEVATMVLRGGPGVLTDGQRRLEGRDFYLDLMSRRGVLRRFGEEGVERVTFDLTTLEPREMDWEVPDSAFLRRREAAVQWILAEAISVFSGEKMVFRRGALYAGTDRVMGLPPLWILALPGYAGVSSSQVLGLNSSGDLAVRFPYFIAAGETSTSAIQLERGTRSSMVNARDDWSLGLAHEYRSGGVSGLVEVAGLPNADWGVQWRDTRLLPGGAETSLNLATPDRRNLFLDANLYDYHAAYSFNLRGFYNLLQESGDAWGVTGEWLTSPRPLDSARTTHFRLGTALGVQQGGLMMPDASPALVSEMYGALDRRAWRLGPSTSLRPSLTNVFRWGSTDFTTNTLRSELRLRHSFGQPMDLNLRYSVQHRSGDTSRPGWQQLLTTDLRYYHGFKWSAYGTTSLDLSSGDWYSYALVNYLLDDAWRLGLLGNWYSLGDTSFDDQELYIGRRLFQDREIGLSYSRLTGKFTLELIGLSTHF